MGLSIGQVAARAGVSVEALRYYETAGLLAPTRDAGGRRQYDDAQVRTLEVVLALRAAGFGVRQIAELVAVKTGVSAPRDRLATAATVLQTLYDDAAARRAQLDRAISLLEQWRAEIDEALTTHPG